MGGVLLRNMLVIQKSDTLFLAINKERIPITTSN